MDDDARSGIDAARKALWSALAKFVGDEQEAMYTETLKSATTGIAAIDALFSYITHEGDRRAQIDARLAFLDRLLNAANEPDDVNELRRGRSGRAKDAAEQLRKASGALALLDNDPLSRALFDLAKIVEARAATSQIVETVDWAN